MSTQTGEGASVKQVPLKRTYPADLRTHFVANVVIQHQPDHFILSFFEVLPPPILGATELEKQAVFEQIDSVEARCVARIVVTPNRMKAIIRALSENYADYERLVAGMATEGEA